MKGINQTHYIGTTVAKPELKYTPAGLAIFELTVAGKTPILTEEGEVRTPVFYNRCKCFGPFAETLADVFEEGDVVSILGRLDYRAWETDDGGKRVLIETVITNINRLEGQFESEQDSRDQPLLLNALNQVTLGGNLTRDSELRRTPSGNAVIAHGLAVNERYTDRRGDEQETVGFYKIEAWRDLAEASQDASKGDGLLVIGRLASDNWTDKDGTRRYGTKIEAERLHLVAHPNVQRSSEKASPANKGKGRAKRRQCTQNLDIDDVPPEEDLTF